MALEKRMVCARWRGVLRRASAEGRASSDGLGRWARSLWQEETSRLLSVAQFRDMTAQAEQGSGQHTALDGPGAGARSGAGAARPGASHPRGESVATLPCTMSLSLRSEAHLKRAYTTPSRTAWSSSPASTSASMKSCSRLQLGSGALRTVQREGWIGGYQVIREAKSAALGHIGHMGWLQPAAQRVLCVG